MAQIRPFRAVRPAEGYEARIAALPYDVYDQGEARRAVAGKPLSFLCIDRAETQLPEGTDPYSPEVYRKAAALYAQEKAEGYFIQEETPCYYIYRLTMEGRSQTGLAACSAVSDYLSGVCKKHENTVQKKEEDRIRHVRALEAQTGPIFLAYRKDAVISELLAGETEKPPLYDFVSEDGIGHKLWRISDPEVISAITERFAEAVPCTYIADGHHRAASAVKAALALREDANQAAAGAQRPQDGRAREENPYDYFLSVLFPDEELCILDYNRVVKELGGGRVGELLSELAKSFRVEPLPGGGKLPEEGPSEPGCFHMYLSGSWYGLRLREELRRERARDPVRSLDVSALQELVLEPLFGIGDPRTDERIEFVGGIRGRGILQEKADRYGGAAFALYPTSISQLMAVADAGRLMPPKSTWFEPKLRSGLLIHELFDGERD